MKETTINDETFALALGLGFGVEETPVIKKPGRRTAKSMEMDEPPKPLVPTQSLLQKWLRDHHNIHIGIRFNKYWIYEIVILTSNQKITGYSTNSNYEDCLEKGLYLALRLIKINN